MTGLCVLSVAVALGLTVASSVCAGEYVVVDQENPPHIANTLFGEAEDLTSPRFKGLAARYGLDKAVEGEKDEFRRILKLRNWLHSHVVVDRDKPAESGDALRMLEASPEGGYYSCGHMMIMQNAVLNAMGHVTRCLFAGAGTKEPRLSGSHGMNEVWVNDLQKWVLVDAEHDSHFEKDGVPLSGLEIRQEVVRDSAISVFRVDGPDRVPQPRERDDSWGRTPRTYAWVSWYPDVDLHTRWPKRRGSQEIVFADDHWRNNTWYRGGKKNWAYDAGAYILIEDAGAIYWTPNVLQVTTTIEGKTARVKIDSETPNLEAYQIKEAGGTWRAAEPEFELGLSADRHDWVLRSINTAGVAGPEYRLGIERSE